MLQKQRDLQCSRQNDFKIEMPSVLDIIYVLTFLVFKVKIF